MTPRAPILLFGMPRSGTTWLGKIFDSHPLVLYRHEPDTWQRLTDVPIVADRATRPTYETRLRAFVDSLPAMRADRVCGKRPLFPKSYATRSAVHRYAVASLLHKGLARAGLGSDPPAPPQPADGKDYRLAWKSIESLGRLGLMLESLPDARSVHIVRHPCGYVASVLRGEAAARFDHNAAAADFPIYEMLSRTAPAQRRGLTLDRFRDMPAVERLAWRWVIFNEFAAEDTAGEPRNRVLYYEELCAVAGTSDARAVRVLRARVERADGAVPAQQHHAEPRRLLQRVQGPARERMALAGGALGGGRSNRRPRHRGFCAGAALFCVR